MPPTPPKTISLLNRLFNLPHSQVYAKADRLCASMRAKVVFRDCDIGAKVRLHGKVVMRNQGLISIGEHSVLLGGMIPSQIICHPQAVLRIGGHSHFNYGVFIQAYDSIVIGRNCMLASLVRICDRDAHRQEPISIGDDVWVAHGAMVMPGVTIGSGSVVSAGSVVTQDIPENSLAMGNPARCMSLNLVMGKPPAA